jgi:hypothetical protein
MKMNVNSKQLPTLQQQGENDNSLVAPSPRSAQTVTTKVSPIHRSDVGDNTDKFRVAPAQ